MIRYRNEKCIHIVGYHYLILLILSTVLMYISAILWIGENTKFKCIFKLWLMIIGVCKIILNLYIIFFFHIHFLLTIFFFFFNIK